MSNTNFKKSIIAFDEAKKSFNKEKGHFIVAVKGFMKERGIPVKILFFGDTFGLDIDIKLDNIGDVPTKIPLKVLSDFCDEFSCDFEYTNCDGHRYIFSFDGMAMGY